MQHPTQIIPPKAVPMTVHFSRVLILFLITLPFPSSPLPPIPSCDSPGQTKLLLGSFTLPVTLLFSLPCPLAPPTPLSVPLTPSLPCLSLSPNSSAYRLHVPAAAWPSPLHPHSSPVLWETYSPSGKMPITLIKSIFSPRGIWRALCTGFLPGTVEWETLYAWSSEARAGSALGIWETLHALALFLRGPHFQKQSFGLFTTWDRVQAFFAEMLERNQLMLVHEFPSLVLLHLLWGGAKWSLISKSHPL